MAASIAYQATATGMAMRTIIGWLIALALCYRQPNGIPQVKMHWLAPEIQACLEGLFRLLLFAVQTIVLAIFDEMRAYFDERKGYISFLALFMQSQYPIIVAWPCPFVVLATADNLLDDALLQIRLQTHGTKQGSAHNTFVLEGQIPEQWQSDVGHSLILTGYVEPDILPAFAEVPRQAGSHPFRPLGQKIKDDIRPLPHDFPGLVPPFVSLFQEKVRSHAHPDKLAALYLITTIAVFLQGIGKILRAINEGAVLPSLLIQRIHIAVGTAGADFLAAMPWIPDIMHFLTQPLL